MARDYYAVLGIGTAASAVQIGAYQDWRGATARRNSGTARARDLRGDQPGLRVLGDPSARTLYDGRPTWARRSRGPGAARQDGAAITCTSGGVAFDQAAAGLTADIAVDRLSACDACGNSGSRPGGRMATCSHCGGAGVVWSGDSAPRTSECPICDGAGERVTEPCAPCRGRGVTPSGGGARRDSRRHGYLLANPRPEGQCGPSVAPAGLIVITRVHDYPVFTRKGDHLYAEVPVISLRRYSAGVSVLTLWGEWTSWCAGTRAEVLASAAGMPRRSGGSRTDWLSRWRSRGSMCNAEMTATSPALPGPPRI